MVDGNAACNANRPEKSFATARNAWPYWDSQRRPPGQQDKLGGEQEQQPQLHLKKETRAYSCSTVLIHAILEHGNAHFGFMISTS